MSSSITTLIATPPLENGDHLTRAEFERRYEAMSQGKKAELIEGVVHMSSPVRHRSHSRPHGRIMVWLGGYVAAAPQVDLGDNATVRLDAENEVQPDALLRLEPEQGGRSRVTEDDYIEGAPELTVEIAASTASFDLREKLRVYRRNQVQEYVVWRVYDRAVDWFRLERGEYIPLQSADGIVRSQVFPGLWLSVDALLAGDMAAVLRTLQDGVATADFKAFSRKLGEQKGT
jgi:Uma2 family endonuclease